jgi:hypothetical protein
LAADVAAVGEAIVVVVEAVGALGQGGFGAGTKAGVLAVSIGAVEEAVAVVVDAVGAGALHAAREGQLARVVTAIEVAVAVVIHQVVALRANFLGGATRRVVVAIPIVTIGEAVVVVVDGVGAGHLTASSDRRVAIAGGIEAVGEAVAVVVEAVAARLIRSFGGAGRVAGA